MKQTFNFNYILICIILVLLCAHIGYGQHYISIYLENGDHLKGRWLGGDAKSIQIEVYEQQLSIPFREIVYITAFDDARAIPSEAAEKHFLNGQTFLQLDMYDRAKASFIKAIDEYPKYTDAHYQLARLFEQEGNNDEALKYFGNVVKIDPNAYSMEDKFKEAGDAYLAAEEYQKAVNTYRLLFRIYPDRYGADEAAYTAGFLLSEELDELEEGLKVLQEAVAHYPDSQHLERASYLIGSAHSKLGNAEMAVGTLTTFIQNYPQSRWLANAYMARGNAYMQLRRGTDAVADYNSVSPYTSNLKLKNEARKKRSESAWTIYTVSDGIPSNQIQAIAIDGQTLWIGTPKGLAQIDLSGGTWQPITDITDHINTLFDEEQPIDVRALAVDNQELWIGTLNRGVIRYNKTTTFPDIFDIRNGLPDNTIYDIKIDKDEVWIGTFAGVARHLRSTGDWINYSEANDGLPADDIVALAVTQDRIWIGTSQNGIAVYNRSMDIWQSFGALDNLDLKAGSEIVSFDVSADRVYFTWNYSVDKANGYGEIHQSDLTSTVEAVLRFVDIVPYQSIYVAATKGPVSAVIPATVWIATNGGVWIKTAGGWRDPIDFPSSRISTPIVSCIALGVGAAWIGTADGLAKIDTSAIYGNN
ncbi:tetratricopeptide repeat protein [Candidatus Poribacteria bacterium]|nr:tetratricopeptide repeat protein [Candidatus Poribacteria bacterium]